MMPALEYLDLQFNSLNGSLPMEIGLVTNVEYLYLTYNIITRSLPTEIGLMMNVKELYLDFNELTGSVSNAVCDVATSFFVDCGTGLVQCGCCRYPTPSPTYSSSPSISLLPSTSPSTSWLPPISPTSLPSTSPSTSWLPSISPASSPSASPSTSWLPSISSAPPSEFLCSSFVSIASIGRELSNISDVRDGVERVNLPFVFQWHGQTNYTQVVVGTKGVVFLGGNYSDVANYFAFPVELGGEYSIPRIADPSIAGNIYVANVDDIFVISWEGIPQRGGLPKNGLNFQVALHPGGTVEICWGDGIPPTNIFATDRAAGIEDDAAGMAPVPATRFPFGSEANDGAAETFLSNQCRICIVTAMGNHTEWPWT